MNSATILPFLVEVTKHGLDSVTFKHPTWSGGGPCSYCGFILYLRVCLTEPTHIAINTLLSSPSDWSQLTSITLKENLDSYVIEELKDIHQIVMHLENFRPPKLREVTVALKVLQPFGTLLMESLPESLEQCAGLEKILITFPKPTLSFSFRPHVNGHRRNLWMPITQQVLSYVGGMLCAGN